MVNRAYALLFIFVALMFWLGWRTRRENSLLSLALFTASIVLTLLLLGGFFGLIGG